MDEKKRIELGMVVKDNVTNFRGTVTARAQFLTGPDRLQVEGFSYTGDPAKEAWFDEERLETEE